jgi:peptide/nickel transport system permease protein
MSAAPDPMVDAARPAVPAARPVRRRSGWRGTWAAFRRSRSGMAGLLVLLALTGVAVLAPLIAGFPSGSTPQVLQPPSAAHPFGTDDLGLDVFAQVVWGARVTMLIGGAASVLALLIGTALGLLGAYYRRLDPLISGLVDVMMSLPILPLTILVAALAGPSVGSLIVVIGAFSWPQVARVIRAQALDAVRKPYVEAAHALGASDVRVLWSHLLPAVAQVMIVNVVLTASRAVLSEAALSFLGLGDPAQWSWGRILLNAQRSGTLAIAWWQTLFSSLAILLAVVSATVVGMALNDARDPRTT